MAVISTKEKTIFDVQDLNVWYGSFQALKNVNLAISKGEVTAIIGPSGCGKSTFLKTLNLMVSRVPGANLSGTIHYNHTDILGNQVDLNELRKEIGMIFQKGNPFPQSIFDNVAYGPRIHGIKNKKMLKQIVASSLEQAAVWDEVKYSLDIPARNLSGGQQQRICIARALATKPDVLLMDEPTSSLDPISTQRIEELIMKLKNDYTVVIVTHNMQQAARISD